jgi:hypothetical protein
MSEEMQLALEHTLKTMRELKEAKAEIKRLRAALREIDHARYTGRNTISPDNAFENAIALNEKLITVMDAARAALAEEKKDDR